MNDNTTASRDSDIEAIAFTPLDESRARRRRRIITGASAAIVTLLLACLVVLGFLLASQTLVVVTAPQEAQVRLAGGFNVRLADAFLTLAGTRELEVSAPGYHDHRQAVTIIDGEDQRLEITLDKKPGQLAVTGVPPETLVELDGQRLGTAPGVFAGIAAGDHRLRLSHPRYRPQEQPVAVEGMERTTEINATLQPAWGDIAISSQPAGATITVGDREVGVTPLTIQVLEQGEPVSLQLAGFNTWSSVLHGDVDEPHTLPTVELAPADATVSITSSPSGARVMVGDQYHGQAPASINLTPGEPHRIALFQEGYRSHSVTLTLERGEQRQLDVRLEPELGAVKVALSPAAARLYVDGRQVSPEDGVLHLPTRPHQLEARLEGYASSRKAVTPKAGVEQQVRLSLITEREAQRRQLTLMVTAPGGQQLKLFTPDGATFTTGASRREQGRRANEIQKPVKLQRPFYFGTTPVTNSAFKRFRVRHSSSHANGNTLDLPDQPVVRITWQDAALYCNWLSEDEGLPPFYQVSDGKVTGINPEATGYRLPTEAEWAWVARHRNGAMKKYAWGEQFPPPANAGNYADQAAAGVVGRVLPGYRDGALVSAPVTRFPPNDLGIYSLGHNVAEWVHDYYGSEAAPDGEPLVDPLGPDRSEFHVIRGASWRHGTITELRLAFRDYGNDKRDDVGFRIARYAQ